MSVGLPTSWPRSCAAVGRGRTTSRGASPACSSTARPTWPPTGVTERRAPTSPVGPATQFQVGSVSKTLHLGGRRPPGRGGERRLGRPAWPATCPTWPSRLRPGLDLEAITVEHSAEPPGRASTATTSSSTARATTSARWPAPARCSPPATGYSYSNAGFSLAGELVEAVDGRAVPRRRASADCSARSASTAPASAPTTPSPARSPCPTGCVGEDAYVIRGAGWQPGWELGPVDWAAGGLVASVDTSCVGSLPARRPGRTTAPSLLSDELRGPASTRRWSRPTSCYSIGLDWFVRVIDGVTTSATAASPPATPPTSASSPSGVSWWPAAPTRPTAGR